MEKYILFFKDTKKFFLEMNLSTSQRIEGIDEYEINLFEKVNHVYIPIVLKAYLNIYGKKADLKGIDLGVNSLLGFQEAYNKAKRMDQDTTAWEILEKENPLVDSEYNKPIKEFIKISNVFFFNYYQEGNVLSFMDNSQIDSPIYLLWEYDYYITIASSSFITNFRTHIDMIIDSLKEEELLVGGEYSWLSKYEKLKMKYSDYKSLLDISTKRKEYYSIIEEKERESNYIYTVSEFQIGFLNYLQEKGYKF